MLPLSTVWCHDLGVLPLSAWDSYKPELAMAVEHARELHLSICARDIYGDSLSAVTGPLPTSYQVPVLPTRELKGHGLGLAPTSRKIKSYLSAVNSADIIFTKLQVR